MKHTDLIKSLTAEGLGNLTDKASELKLDVSTWTLLRWIKDGVQGGRHKLEAIRAGGRWKTSRQALLRFLEATNQPVGPKRSSPKRRASKAWSQSVLESHRLPS